MACRFQAPGAGLMALSVISILIKVCQPFKAFVALQHGISCGLKATAFGFPTTPAWHGMLGSMRRMSTGPKKDNASVQANFSIHGFRLPLPTWFWGP